MDENELKKLVSRMEMVFICGYGTLESPHSMYYLYANGLKKIINKNMNYD